MWSALRLARRIISGSLKNSPAFPSQRASGSSRQTPRCPFQRSSKRSLLGSHRRQRPKKTSNRLCWPKSSLASVNKARLSWRVIGSASAQLRIRRHAARSLFHGVCATRSYNRALHRPLRGSILIWREHNGLAADVAECDGRECFASIRTDHRDTPRGLNVWRSADVISYLRRSALCLRRHMCKRALQNLIHVDQSILSDVDPHPSAGNLC